MLVRSLPGGAGELAGLLEDCRPESLLLALPLGAVFEELLPSLDAGLTPPEGGVWGNPPVEAVKLLS